MRNFTVNHQFVNDNSYRHLKAFIDILSEDQRICFYINKFLNLYQSVSKQYQKQPLKIILWNKIVYLSLNAIKIPYKPNFNKYLSNKTWLVDKVYVVLK